MALVLLSIGLWSFSLNFAPEIIMREAAADLNLLARFAQDRLKAPRVG
jgi:hypothetical protein